MMSNTKRVTDHNDLLEQLAASCDSYAEAMADAALLENTKKVILAHNKPEKGTVAQKEDAAYLSDDYAKYVAKQREADRNKFYWIARRDYLKEEHNNSRTERADIRAVTKGV